MLEPGEVAAALELARARGVEADEVPRLGIEPVLTVTLLLSGTTIAVAAVLHVLDQRKGGQVVDLRPGAPKQFYRTPDVVYGTVVIVSTDGQASVEVREPEGLFGKVIATLPELVSGGGGSAAEVAQSVAETFGPDVTVREQQR
ncbi:hypothetical protein OHA21_26825 [Actinoplanes sp. NBC_00393]|uniref:hypothetical protein n=1 Tax=Actinoplanes sp. NBC_00393 TaxID=2975953 RepID=UPI002E1D858F